MLPAASWESAWGRRKSLAQAAAATGQVLTLPAKVICEVRMAVL